MLVEMGRYTVVHVVATMVMVMAVATGIEAAGSGTGRFGIGRPATADEIAGWDIDVAPDGAGLPNGRGSVAQGKAIFAQRCAACHGEHGEGGPMDRLVGGIGSLHDKKPLRTVGSYWPYATTLYDYVHRAMPFDAPQSLQPDEVYAVTAYVLFLNTIVPDGTVLDRARLLEIRMPNRDGFFSAWPMRK